MKQASFFREESAVAAVAARQAKTDPLFLARTVREAAERKILSETDIDEAHRIPVKWTDLEKSGQLASRVKRSGRTISWKKSSARRSGIAAWS